MQIPIILAKASNCYGSLFFVLLLALAIAAIIWLILWLLSDDTSDSADASTTDFDATPSPEPEANAETGEPKVEEAPESTPEPEEDEESEDGDGDDDFEAASAEEAAALFASELSEGLVTQDPVYGIIYQEAPEDADDLKEIKGVGKVLESKLNGIGVFRFKQVAVWTDAACEEFSKMLTFKNRIYSDNWLAQAKDFHERKYGEKL